MEDSLSEGNTELKNQIRLLQDIIKKKENKVQDLTQSLIQAVAEIERERKHKRKKDGRHVGKNALMCTVL